MKLERGFNSKGKEAFHIDRKLNLFYSGQANL